MAPPTRPRGPRRRTFAGLTLVALAATGAGLTACGGDGGSPAEGAATATALGPAARRGEAVVRQNGCSACHSTDGSQGPGPTFRGLYGSGVELEDGSTATADEGYLTRAIQRPQAQVAAGYDIQMPANSLDDQDTAAVVDYLRSLKD